MGAFKRLSSTDDSEKRWLWALNNVTLDIQQGELVGIIGRNGAGKSTLLKVLSRITYPTSGRMEVTGRLASLLEVGTGFHEELTGRENIYLNGSILGMRKKEIASALEAIVEFADIGRFLDTPIKRYSSGMRMRLGFSVAAHLHPDVMFVDEVLAVGDIGFQKKCLGAIRELGEGGRTVLFVSHNLSAVENLCHRAVWIAGGKIALDGPSRDVIKAYLASFGGSQGTGMDLSGVAERRGTGYARFTRIEFLNGEGQQQNVIHSGDSLTARIHYECYRSIPNIHFGLRIVSDLGTLITETSTFATGVEIPVAPKGKGVIDLDISFLNLMPGSYYLGLWASSFWEKHDFLENFTTLDVEPSNYYGSGRGIEAQYGMIFLPCKWRPGEDAAPEAAAVNLNGEAAVPAPARQLGTVEC